MALAPDEIARLIQDALPDTALHIEDVRGDGTYYTAYIESPAFRGKSRIDQHRMVYKVLQDKMGEEIQSLSLRTSVPANAL